MLSSSLATTESDAFGAFMQKLFRSDYLIDAGAGGIEHSIRFARHRHHYFGRALTSYINVIGLGPGISRNPAPSINERIVRLR
jgi:hypothetical protein